MPASRWPYLLAYLAAVIVAEVLITIPGGSTGQSIGLSIHILLVFTLMFLSVLIQPKDATLCRSSCQLGRSPTCSSCGPVTLDCSSNGG